MCFDANGTFTFAQDLNVMEGQMHGRVDHFWCQCCHFFLIVGVKLLHFVVYAWICE
jgi:hypothetical protein